MGSNGDILWNQNCDNYNEPKQVVMVSIKWMSLLTPTRQGSYVSKSISQKACPWLALTKILTHVIVSKPQSLHKSLENVVQCS